MTELVSRYRFPYEDQATPRSRSYGRKKAFDADCRETQNQTIDGQGHPEEI